MPLCTFSALAMIRLQPGGSMLCVSLDGLQSRHSNQQWLAQTARICLDRLPAKRTHLSPIASMAGMLPGMSRPPMPAVLQS